MRQPRRLDEVDASEWACALREAADALAAERKLADDLAAVLERLVPADGVLGPATVDVLARYRAARQ